MEVFAAATGRQQKELLGEAWSEYRERHADELRAGLEWARGVLDNPAEAAVQASGMPASDIAEIEEAFGRRA